jgi:ribonucleoside-diphosphate reductase alpha chain
MKRKMGIGVCGLADMLIALRLPYDSQEARELARDVLSFINYISKCTSVALAEQRGSCLAMNFPLVNKYVRCRYLEDKYMERPTRTVSSRDWEKLAHTIRTTRKLRNISTTALAPTGRASILLGVTSSIEPMFSIFASDGSLQKNVLDFLSEELEENEQDLQQVCQKASFSGSFQDIEILPSSVRLCLKTAKEIAPLAHLQMVADLAGVHGVTDESASKTVNLPYSATVDDVKDIFLSSFHLGLKNISVYRDKTMVGQPVDV